MRWKFVIFFILCGYFLTTYAEPLVDVNRESALRIGIKIWYNECNGRISGLTSWNEGEKFASLGIGHFNWFPNKREASSKDGFPQLIKYMERNGVTIPTWLQGEIVPPCPWHSRTQFIKAENDPKMVELRQFLIDTIPIQAQFMVYRLVNALPKLISTSSYEDREYIFNQFLRLSRTPQGVYALVDYVNFKGEGTCRSANKPGGWGLLQVVENMKYAPQQLDILPAFVWSANRVLTERVRKAPPTSHESKWLVGWRKRIGTYLN